MYPWWYWQRMVAPRCHAEQVVVQADLLQQQEQRQGRGVEREQQPGHEQQEQSVASAEGVPGQREGGHRAEHHGQRGRHHRDDRAVLDRPPEHRGLIGRHRDQADRRHLAIALSLASHEFLDRYRDPVNALESRMLHGTTKPQVTALRRTLTTCHANLAPGQPRLP
jgi:hypothetical protein